VTTGFGVAVVGFATGVVVGVSVVGATVAGVLVVGWLVVGVAVVELARGAIGVCLALGCAFGPQAAVAAMTARAPKSAPDRLMAVRLWYVVMMASGFP
jgi:hypothetical protein